MAKSLRDMERQSRGPQVRVSRHGSTRCPGCGGVGDDGDDGDGENGGGIHTRRSSDERWGRWGWWGRCGDVGTSRQSDGVVLRQAINNEAAEALMRVKEERWPKPWEEKNSEEQRPVIALLCGPPAMSDAMEAAAGAGLAAEFREAGEMVVKSDQILGVGGGVGGHRLVCLVPLAVDLFYFYFFFFFFVAVQS